MTLFAQRLDEHQSRPHALRTMDRRITRRA